MAFLIFGDSENWLRVRTQTQKGKGMILGFLYVGSMFLRGLPRLMADFARWPGRKTAMEAAPPVARRPAHLLAFGVDLDEHEKQERERLLAADVPVIEERVS